MLQHAWQKCHTRWAGRWRLAELGGGIFSSLQDLQPWAVSQLFAHCHLGGLHKTGKGAAEPSPAQGGGHCGASGAGPEALACLVQARNGLPTPHMWLGGLLGPWAGLWLATLSKGESANIPACTQDLNPLLGTQGGTFWPS